MERKVLVPIADGTEEIEAVCIIDILRRAGVAHRSYTNNITMSLRGGDEVANEATSHVRATNAL